MKKLHFAGAVFVLAWVVFAALPPAVDSAPNRTVNIEIAPKTLLLGSTQGGEVTVHAEIAYSAVDHASLTLGGIAVSWTKSDSRGELVAKFDEGAVKAIVTPPAATLELAGFTADGEYFSGSAVVAVRD
jgi:hypothetical protein